MSQRQLIELGLMGLTGLLHVVVEMSWGGAPGNMIPSRPERMYNLSATVVWGVYVLWRIIRNPGQARQWGMRRDTLAAACRPGAIVIAVGGAALWAYGALHGRGAPHATVWITLLLYPLYGIAQQVALQGLVTTNLRGLIRNQTLRILVVAGLFSAAHTPDGSLMVLAVLAGLAFTWLYESCRNIWVVGIAHGLLGALAYPLALGLDPGAEILRALQG